jgi:general secretion pathway protein G
MGRVTRIGEPAAKRGGRRGFTLIELLLVLLIVALLASLVAPVVTGSIQRAKESTLKEDLYVMRKAIDDYYADSGKYPELLSDLVTKQYLRRIPRDPLTESAETWVLVRSDGGGIVDVRSGAPVPAEAAEGAPGEIPYSDW